jgi:hypothetical protein
MTSPPATPDPAGYNTQAPTYEADDSPEARTARAEAADRNLDLGPQEPEPEAQAG